MLFKIVLTMHNWIKADPLNVAIVHCIVGVIAIRFVRLSLFVGGKGADRHRHILLSVLLWPIQGPSRGPGVLRTEEVED